MPLRDVKGAIHVHTRMSDGSGSVAEVASAAESAGLDFVIITDHDTTEAAEEVKRDRNGGVLVVVGAEISPAGRGHALALGADDVKGYRWMPERFFLHKLQRDGAETYIAHPEGRAKPTFGVRLREWNAWQEERFCGIEIWSYMHDWLDSLSYMKLLEYYLHPDRAISGPDQRVLGLWDRLNRHRRVVGIGALDAHAVRKLFGLLVAFPYEFLFRTVLTHVLVRSWGRGYQEDTLELRRSLKEGRAYVSYETQGAAEGFRFRTDDGVMMGARAPLDGSRRLLVRAPAEAEITLFKDGRVVGRDRGCRAAFDVADPGACRVELRRDGKPWIFSNHISLL